MALLCLDPPTEPSTALELHEALFSWDPIGASQKTFISHLQVKKVCGTNTLGEFPDKQDTQIHIQEMGEGVEHGGRSRCAGSSLRGNDPLYVHVTPPHHFTLCTPLSKALTAT